MTALVPTKRKSLFENWDQAFDPFEWNFFHGQSSLILPPLDSLPEIKNYKVEFRESYPSIRDIHIFADFYRYNVTSGKSDILLAAKVEAKLVDDIFVFRAEDGDFWYLLGMSWVQILDKKGIYARGIVPKSSNDWRNLNTWQNLEFFSKNEVKNIEYELPDPSVVEICDPNKDPDHPHNRMKNLLDLKTPCSTGLERCVISFALWCSDSSGARHECQEYLHSLEYLHFYAEIYKGWEIRVYTDDSMLKKLTESYSQFNIIRVEDEFLGNGTWGMMWRMLPLFDPSVDRFISRDIDARATIRGWGAVYEWIRSGYPSLRITDHVYHSGWPSFDKWWGIMGGMYGLRTNALTEKQKSSLLEKLRETPHVHAHYGDQNWLRDNLWPLVGHGIMSFTSQYCESERQRKASFGEWSLQSLGRIRRTYPWPIPHTQCDFIVGVAYAELSPVVPQGCRHPNHPDWIFG